MSIFDDDIPISPESLSDFGFECSQFCPNCWIYEVFTHIDFVSYGKIYQRKDLVAIIMYDEYTKSLYDDNNVYDVETIEDIELIVDMIKINAK